MDLRHRVAVIRLELITFPGCLALQVGSLPGEKRWYLHVSLVALAAFIRFPPSRCSPCRDSVYGFYSTWRAFHVQWRNAATLDLVSGVRTWLYPWYKWWVKA